MRTNDGVDIQSGALLGKATSYGDASIASPTVTYASTTLTDATKSWTTNAFAGQYVVAGIVVGLILSNTATVLTVDGWSSASSPGTSASTPGANTTYTILPGQAPSLFLALSTDTASPNLTDTTLTSELSNSGGGLNRGIATVSHTAGATSSVASRTFTANSSDAPGGAGHVFPYVIAKMAMCQSRVAATGKCLVQTLFGATATVAQSGDQITATDTFSF